MPLLILSKRLALFANDARLGFRLVARRWKQLDRAKRKRIELSAVLSLLPLSAAIAGLAAVPSAFELDQSQVQAVVESVATPTIADQMAELLEREDTHLREVRVQRGETLAALFTRLGISDTAALRFGQTHPSARALLRLPPGRFVQASITSDGALHWLKVHSAGDLDGVLATTRILTLDRSANAEPEFQVAEADVALERRVEVKAGEVRVSLFGATDEAGVPDAIAQQMIDALESEVDFHRDLQRGDRFRVIYEALYSSGEYLRAGRLLAVELEVSGKRLSAYWFANGSKHGGFYAADGRSLKQAFLRSPLVYTRVSSGFSSSRTHPIFGYDAAHRGVDYSAPAGTGVRSIAEGVVTFAGWQRGYGNVVEIRHDGKHVTLYAHLQSIAPNLRQGVRVGQSDWVGTVGMTGWATGPHLHFELKIHDAHVNPLTAELPSAQPLAVAQLSSFALASAPLRAQLALLERVAIA
ncbi:MAG: peptidoglycan DD-metalloendopeptidase family protein, partial [Burkholderiaceae bacterium]|nr:peptidoglycan DD-metalloendopeptidase family protein [Burkholderiaceae bacterium]